MRTLFSTAVMSLLMINICSCGGGGSNDTVDCSSIASGVQTSTNKMVGAAVLTATQSGDSTYAIMGTNLDGVAGIQLSISYDVTSLATPTVTQGALIAGAMLASNSSIPGLIRIAVISTRAFSGSGEIANISFASKTGSGGITSITYSMIDSKGSPVVAFSNFSTTENPATTPGIPFSQPVQQQSSATAIPACR